MLGLLTLKLLDKERLSHIDDFNCDQALGLFAGLLVFALLMPQADQREA